MFVEGSEGGLDLLFRNKKTKEWTWYTPKGMTPEQIVQIPRAGKYFTEVYAEQYIKRMAAERQRDAEEGSLDPDVSGFLWFMVYPGGLTLPSRIAAKHLMNNLIISI